MDHDKLIQECKDKHIRIWEYVLDCPDRALRYRALLILARGHEDRDHVILQCKKAYDKVRSERIQEANRVELEEWKRFLVWKNNV